MSDMSETAADYFSRSNRRGSIVSDVDDLSIPDLDLVSYDTVTCTLHVLITVCLTQECMLLEVQSDFHIHFCLNIYQHINIIIYYPICKPADSYATLL